MRRWLNLEDDNGGGNHGLAARWGSGPSHQVPRRPCLQSRLALERLATLSRVPCSAGVPVYQSLGASVQQALLARLEDQFQACSQCCRC